MKDEIKEILDELKAIVETKDYENGLVYIEHSYLKVIHYYITNLQEENKKLKKINDVALTYNKHLMLCERQRHNLQHLKQMESILKGEGLE